MLVIQNGLVHDAVHPEAYRADIVIQDSRILTVGDAGAPEKADIFDASGMDVWPGLIDAHTHIGMFGYGGPLSKDDDELYSSVCPQHRGIDAVNPNSVDFSYARRGGVTAVGVGPGSVESIGGTHFVMKTAGLRVDRMIVKNPSAMKVAFGESPKGNSLDKKASRMTVASQIRDALSAAREYRQKKMQGAAAFHPGYEALIPVLDRSIPLKAHAHRLDDIFTAIRIAREFNVRLTLEHCTEGGLAAEELAAEGIPICAGPFFSAPHKEELSSKHPSLTARLIQAGCHVCVMTDFPVVSEEYLAASAGLLIREGIDAFEALKTVTVNAAEHLGVADRMGTIEAGKDADLVITRGSVLDLAVRPESVLINGRRVV